MDVEAASLSSGEIAVVTQVHAPDPYRPRVRILIGPTGERLEVPHDKNLFDATTPDAAAIIAPVDPAEYGVDPLTYL